MSTHLCDLIFLSQISKAGNDPDVGNDPKAGGGVAKKEEHRKWVVLSNWLSPMFLLLSGT